MKNNPEHNERIVKMTFLYCVVFFWLNQIGFRKTISFHSFHLSFRVFPTDFD
jgi:hypothetical protein